MIFFVQHNFAQKAYPQDYFRSPLDFRLLLSGTFGETRADHFHSGIDIKTNGTEGATVYAIADGYVSRIKVSPFGYGNALYITHPNGYVSVYGHLSRYNDALAAYVRQAQYQQEKFEVELFPAVNQFPVKKGDVVAYSGNTGSSAGPHLHFELREAATERPVNPLLFGFDVKDFYRPHISSIKIYPENENSTVNGEDKAVRYQVDGWGLEHRLSGDPAITLSGNISFAIQVYDQQNDTDNKNGPYAISLLIDSVKVFNIKMESFSYDETRYVNSLLDYAELMRTGARLERTKIDPGNKLDMYGKVADKGIYPFNDDRTHRIRYEVTDVAGNLAVLAFNIKSIPPTKTVGNQIENKKYFNPADSNFNFQVSNFHYNTPNYFNNGSVIVNAPKGAFYDSFVFRCDSARQIPNTFSKVYKIQDKYTPVQDYINLSIRSVNLPEDLQEKAVIVKINDDNKTFTSAGGHPEGDAYIGTRVREFGNYSIAVDTVPPDVQPVHPEHFLKMAGQKQLKLIIKDNLSGIASYRGMLNGKWILMEYDAKKNMLIYNVDEALKPGRNTLLVEVTDNKSNHAYFAATLIL